MFCVCLHKVDKSNHWCWKIIVDLHRIVYDIFFFNHRSFFFSFQYKILEHLLQLFSRLINVRVYCFRCWIMTTSLKSGVEAHFQVYLKNYIQLTFLTWTFTRRTQTCIIWHDIGCTWNRYSNITYEYIKLRDFICPLNVKI